VSTASPNGPAPVDTPVIAVVTAVCSVAVAVLGVYNTWLSRNVRVKVNGRMAQLQEQLADARAAEKVLAVELEAQKARLRRRYRDG
jgi:hypothetical protein